MDDKRRAAGQKLLDAAHEFFRACHEEGQRAAVQWLRGSDGELVIFTRGEYRETLMANIDKLANLGVHYFNGEAMPADPTTAASQPASADVERRPCTCHPDDNPPIPCPRMYALQDCRRAAALAAEIESLRARLAEAERDAVRYRWLRDRAWPFEFNGNTPVDADAAIDAAMRPPAKKHTPHLKPVAIDAHLSREQP